MAGEGRLGPRKIVFPAAGLGTRFLPATKATPKEMLPIVDRPLIQYGVEEALAAGMDDIVMITGRGKRAIEDHFDISAELEANLQAAGKAALYAEISRIARMANIAYVRQKQALGLGHAVLCAARWVGDEPFGVLLADELITGTIPAMRQLAEVHARTGHSVIGLARVPRAMASRYGMVSVREEEGLLRLVGMVEKPAPEDAPSDLAIIGRYLFTPTIFDCLREVRPGAQNEIQLTDAMAMLAEREPMHGVVIAGERIDAGQPEGFLRANLTLGLGHPEYGPALRESIRRLLDY
ncbi:MAG: UTP--glucose-1-phosphate uridylyltransferase GalU [Mariprofundaceae bacterium]